MGFTRTFRAVSGAVLAGALVLVSAPGAAADQTREDQWPLEAFDAQAIWKISKGEGVTVAVIDEGVYADHVDLKGNVIQGKDFVDGGATTPKYGDSHGTSMAAIIAGHGHGPGSSDGVMGLAPETKILDIRDIGLRPDGFAGSIRYAVDHGASVINISQGGPGANDEKAEADAIAYAFQKDVLVVASTGNNGQGVEFPANYPGVVAVGGVKNDGTIWEDSNRGPSALLSAPATSIVSAGNKSDTAYVSGTGTSDATAFVSAAAALLRSKFPDLTAGQIANRLTKTAGLPDSAKSISLPDERYGYGFIQPLAALKEDIPAGSKNGPLSVPESLKGGTGNADTAQPSNNAAAGDDESSSSTAESKRIIILAGVGLVALVVLALVILLIVKIARRGKRDNGGPGGPGGPGTPNGWGGNGRPQYGQPPHQQQYPGQSGNPYQQQPQGPGQWSNQ